MTIQQPIRLETLGALLGAMAPQGDQNTVRVSDVLARIGDRSFAPAILILAVGLVSPLSGIPGAPTIGGLIIALIAFQALLGRTHLWLPGVLMRRGVSARNMQRAIRFLERPAHWMDQHSHGRLRLLSYGPMRAVAFLVSALIALSWPFFEILPFFTSFGAGAVSMIMFGLLTRDGLYIVLGYAQSVALYTILVAIYAGLF